MSEEVCQCCGEPIAWGSPVIAVRYGTIWATVNHTSVSKDRVDYFHQGCDVAIAKDGAWKIPKEKPFKSLTHS